MFVPEKVWWHKLGRYEKNWLVIAFIWCLILTVMMPIWFIYGKQNVPTETYRTNPAQFQEVMDSFVAAYQVGEENGIPIVAPEPGGDAYILGRQWQWYPILKLKQGETYRVHLSSMDVSHGFSLQPVNLNFMVIPDYDYVVTLTPTTAGDFSIVCNEYCLVGHHIMTGKIIVEE